MVRALVPGWQSQRRMLWWTDHHCLWAGKKDTPDSPLVSSSVCFLILSTSLTFTYILSVSRPFHLPYPTGWFIKVPWLFIRVYFIFEGFSSHFNQFSEVMFPEQEIAICSCSIAGNFLCQVIQAQLLLYFEKFLFNGRMPGLFLVSVFGSSLLWRTVLQLKQWDTFRTHWRAIHGTLRTSQSSGERY